MWRSTASEGQSAGTGGTKRDRHESLPFSELIFRKPSQNPFRPWEGPRDSVSFPEKVTAVSGGGRSASGRGGLGIDPEAVGEPVVVGEEAGDLNNVMDGRVAEAGGAEGLDVVAAHRAGLAGELDREGEHGAVGRGERRALLRPGAAPHGRHQRLSPLPLIRDLGPEV